MSDDSSRTARHDVSVYNGPGGWRTMFRYYQPDGTTPLNMTGYAVTARMAPKGEGETSETTLELTEDNDRLIFVPLEGTVTLRLAEDEKALIPSRPGRETEYEVVVLDSLGDFFHRWHGLVGVVEPDINA